MENGRSYLFVTWDGGGNVPPVLGIARRLIERGHAVSILTEPCLANTVAAMGARFVPFQRHFAREDCSHDIMGDWQAKTPIGALRRNFDNVVFGPAPIVAEETWRAIELERPDVVAADHLLPGALVAARAAGVPRVVLFHTPEFLPGPGKPAAGSGFLPRRDFIGRARDEFFNRAFLRMISPYLATFNDLHRRFGLPPMTSANELIEQYHHADRRLIMTSEAYDFPITPAPANARYVGPVLDDPEWSSEWENPWSDRDDRPLVVGSLSSTFQNQREALQRIITALGMLDARGLVTTGPAMRGERFDAPANVVVVSAAPHSDIFPHAAAVITHAGHGTVMRALANGVPLLCLPMGRDQNDNAARVVARGAGLRLGLSARPQRIAAAAQRLLHEPSFRAGARRLGSAIAADAAAELAVAELEAVGDRGTVPAF
jgi:MGT family glycosyltransferase